MLNEQNENKKERRTFAPGLCFSKLVWVFLISCVVGFLVETLWCYIRHGYIESRQSLVYGPPFCGLWYGCSGTYHGAV